MVECQASVNVVGGPLVTATPTPIRGYAASSGSFLTDSLYAEAITKALDDLSEEMKAQIKSP
jgi:hypothetical protein